MKVCGFWIFFMVVGAELMLFAFSSGTSSVSDAVFFSYGDEAATTSTRKLKMQEKGDRPTTIERKKRDEDNLSVEDYGLIDPVPSSKAAIKNRPIEHGTPLMPYIPKPAPPAHPKHGGSP